jgi:hypothetical protein
MLHCGDNGNPVEIEGKPLDLVAGFGCLFDAFLKVTPDEHREVMAELLKFALETACESYGVKNVKVNEDAAKRAAEEYMASLTRGKKGE